jgi:hypothetical protein
MRTGALAWLGRVALGLAALAAAGGHARADGAVAVGSTGNVVRDGIAFGMVVDETKEAAAETAVKRCRTFEARAAAERCQVVATFSGECFAVAYDPKPGTPGAGWGVGPDQLAANRKAIAMCEQAAGPARKGYCQVESGGCDTTGQRAASKPGAQGQARAAPEAANSAPKSETKTEGTPAAKAKAPLATPKPPPAAQAKRPLPAEARARSSGSPLLPVGAMVGVGIAYALGQHVRGKLKGGIAERQILTGGALAVAAAIAIKILDMAGAEPIIAFVLAGLVALGAALLA